VGGVKLLHLLLPSTVSVARDSRNLGDLHESIIEINLKETVSRDFRPSVFFIKLYPWVP
jgi:hypothetical protein